MKITPGCGVAITGLTAKGVRTEEDCILVAEAQSLGCCAVGGFKTNYGKIVDVGTIR